jgi:glycosyltransferase involved in cell wall biosynthesis
VVSCVIPAYNGASTLQRAIDSVVAQGPVVSEIIVVDDGSTDETAAVARANPVRYIYQENQGVAAARNRGAREASEAFVGFLDADDEWLANKSLRQMEALRDHPEALLCYCWYEFSALTGPAKVVRPNPPGALFPGIRLGNNIPGTVIMVRKEEFLAAGGFRPIPGASCEDWEFVARIARTFPCTVAEEVLARLHEMPTSNSRKPDFMLQRSLEIVEDTLLAGLSGLERQIWRRRVLASLYFRSAIGHREVNAPWVVHLLRSFMYWPSPLFIPVRFKVLPAYLLRRLSGR